MTSKPNSAIITKEEKEFANGEITAAIDNMRKEQKKEREQNKNLKAELRNVVNELFTLPELRTRAHRLLNQAVEAATQELANKNYGQTQLCLSSRSISSDMSNITKNQDTTSATGIEADNEHSSDKWDEIDKRLKTSVVDTEDAASIQTDTETDDGTILSGEGVFETDNQLNDLVAEIDKVVQECEDSLTAEFENKENESLTDDILSEAEIQAFENSTNLFEDILWDEEENMAKNISDANEMLLMKALNDKFEDKNIELFKQADYVNPFKVEEELSNIYAEKLKKLEETTAGAKNQMSLHFLVKDVYVNNKEKRLKSDLFKLSSNTSISGAEKSNEENTENDNENDLDSNALTAGMQVNNLAETSAVDLNVEN